MNISNCRRKLCINCELVIFRAAHPCKIIAAYPERRRCDIGMTIFEAGLCSPEEYESTMTFTAEILHLPVITVRNKYSSHPTLLIRGITSSVDLCALLILDVPAESIHLFADSGELDLVAMLDFLESDASTRDIPSDKSEGDVPSDNDESRCNDFIIQMVKRARDGLCAGSSAHDGSLLICATEAAKRIAGIVGCSLEIGSVCRYVGASNGKFDCDLFYGLSLLTLIVCAREGECRSATMDIRYNGADPTVYISTKLYCKSPLFDRNYHCDELDECRTISDRLHLAYDCIIDKAGMLTLRFCPLRRDWSRLGIKTDISLEYD